MGTTAINLGKLMLGAAVGFAAITSPVMAQDDSTPAPSPGASVTQTIGTSDVTITYSRPGVKDRKVWGELVPYNEVWRAGANARTTWEFEPGVKINGTELKAGKYGFFILPTEKDWTLIFTEDTTSPAQLGDAEKTVRLTVTPEEAPMRERLMYGFDDMTDTQGTAWLHWEKLMAKVTIEPAAPKKPLVISEEAKPAFAVLEQVLAALTAGDVDKMVGYYADDFTSDQGMDKAGMTTFLADAKAQGFLDGIAANLDALAISVEGDKGKVENIELEGSFGILTLGFEMAKRDGKWVITYQSQV